MKIFLIFAIMLAAGIAAPRARADEIAAPRAALQAGEIRLQGRVEGVSFASRQVTISFNTIEEANGVVTPLAVPRWKIVAWNEATSFVAPAQNFVANAPLTAPRDEANAAENAGDAETPDAAELPPQIQTPQTPTPAPRLTVDALWPRKAISVVGRNGDNGAVFAAREIEIGTARAALFQAAAGTAFPDSRFYNGVKEWVAASGLRAAARFAIPDIGGKAARGNATSDHPRGLALDFMVGRNAKLGDLIATYFQQFAGLENVSYIIWKDHLAYANPRTDWAKIPTDYTGNITLRHMDHVHVSFLPAPEMPGPYLPAALTNAQKTVPRRQKKRFKRTRRVRSNSTVLR